MIRRLCREYSDRLRYWLLDRLLPDRLPMPIVAEAEGRVYLTTHLGATVVLTADEAFTIASNLSAKAFVIAWKRVAHQVREAVYNPHPN